MKRKIVQIDESLCDGCGQCVPACAEGAIQIIDGKARLISDQYCDGLGACLGECPQGAITVIERDADEFDEEAVARHLQNQNAEPQPRQQQAPPPAHGCPASRILSFPEQQEVLSQGPRGTKAGPAHVPESKLRQWPVQLHLLSPKAPYFDNADLLICADCVPFAMGDFHNSLLNGHALAIACPKLDDTRFYGEKLAGIFAQNNIRSITIAIMEVPCCSGLVQLVTDALKTSGKKINADVKVLTLRGQIKTERS